MDEDNVSEFECPICLDPFCEATKPMMLVDCGHNVCESCLINLPKRICPLCRAPIIFKSMPNRLVVSLLEKRKVDRRAVIDLASKFQMVQIANEQMKHAILSMAQERADLQKKNHDLKWSVDYHLQTIMEVTDEKHSMAQKLAHLEKEVEELRIEQQKFLFHCEEAVNSYSGCNDVRNGKMLLNYIIY